MNVVIVESPAKAKTINKYLGSDYEVVASFGHVRDLPAKDGSVDPNADFAMVWEADGRGAKRIGEIAKMVKGASKLILATDPDREGEAISWHLLEALRDKRVLKDVPVERVTFNAITKQAVLDAMANPRAIDVDLVEAYLARRALDYLVGFNLSPVLWRKLPGARSAGRVQSVALRLVCEREAEIERFVKREYWSLVATLATPRAESFEARLVGADGQKIQRLDVGTEAEARAFEKALNEAHFAVAAVEAKPARRHPFPPFTTSTLQQEASRKYGFAPNRTMQIAQRLYEGADIGGETVGLITYMRTDGVDVAPEAVAEIRSLIGKDFGARYVPGAPRKYTSKVKNAQEAHEAIRPTDVRRHPRDVARFLEPEQARLYELIWKRTVASQMESAELERTTVDIIATVGGLGSSLGRKLDLRATGQVVKFDGFLTLYTEDRDDDGDDEDGKRLPAMTVGEKLSKQAIAATQHFTEPPPRYSEASLVKRMEELGIGRPSTYAATLQTLQDRDYVRVEKKRLVPEDKGRLVIAFLENFFNRYVEYGFTAALEEQLDLVSNHELDWKALLRDFWRDFTAAIDSTKELRVADVLSALNESLGPHIFPDRGDGTNPRLCPTCGSGTLSLKLGKFGAFIGCSNYPECRYTRQLAAPSADAVGDAPAGASPDGTRRLGEDPDTGLEVTVRDGRFGPYIQLGEGDKPKRSSLPKGLSPAEIDIERALALLALPKEVAVHPESGKPILVGIGRYGPYVQHERTYANLEKDDDVLAIGSNRAIDLIVAKESGAKGRFGRAAAAPGRELGEHPTLGGPVTVMAGRYGPYVKHGSVNATLPKGKAPDSLTMDEAVQLIAARAEAAGSRPKGGRRAKANGEAKPAARAKSAAKPKAAAKKAVKPAEKAKT
ncbi:type I DNA topoisomerase [Phreatobacter sp. AB_2022a]|uniref:type I DNA topoisomerase n=1 Tax=Phreatobacter sp. AB_2022a TaxID=3003134 RepID=UPI002286F74D|nr:type I DNA topoisomerase [Phreatobacter sp. AB_2022a]MCZ0733403.1 type I DNA topoisomerase [Phreatobacter sp. AB_2022a]